MCPSAPLRFFLLGLLSLTLQTALVREALFAFHGGEIGLGLFFAVWLASIALGSRLTAASSAARAPVMAVRAEGSAERGATGAGPHEGPPRGSPRSPRGLGSLRDARRALVGADACGVYGRPARKLALSFDLGLVLLPVLGIAQVFVFRHQSAILQVEAGGYLPLWSYVLLLLAGVAPAGLLTGALFPIGLEAGRIRAGDAYAIEAFGSMTGGALAALYALPRVAIVTLLGAGALVATAWLVVTLVAPLIGAGHARPHGSHGAPRERRRMRRVAGIAAAVGVLIAALGLLLGGGLMRLDQAWARARWTGLHTGTEPVVSFDTPYHQVTVGRREHESSLFLDGFYLGALADPYTDSLAAAVVMTQHPRPRDVLLLAPALIGPTRVIARSAGTRATIVRADDRLDDVVERVPAVRYVKADPRVALRGRDLATPGGGWDLIAVLEGGATSGASNRLYTREFFADCARRLRPGGVLTLEIAGDANVASPEAANTRAAIVAALRAVFRDVRVAPGTTYSLFAADPRGAPPAPSPLTWDPDSLAARRARIWPGGAPWPARLFHGLFPPERVDALQAEIDRAVRAGVPENRDSRPIVYFEQLRRWDRLSGSRLSGWLGAWRAHPWGWSAGLLLVLASLGWRLRRGLGPAAVSLASTGLVGMGADLVVLLLYQTARGTLYLRVGVVVALYMAGLGLGALWGGRSPARGPLPWKRIVWADLAWVGFFAIWVPLLGVIPRLGALGCEILLLALALLSGVLTALPFAWVAGELEQRRAGYAAGGIANACDHAGALFGALVTGTLLVPLLGFAATLGLLAGVKLLSASAWIGRR
jgi:spermidine synthase